jgi:hypothetical protein
MAGYRSRAERKGWQERRDQDLFGVLTGLTGPGRNRVSSGINLVAFQKAKQLLLLGVLPGKDGGSSFATVEIQGPATPPGGLDRVWPGALGLADAHSAATLRRDLAGGREFCAEVLRTGMRPNAVKERVVREVKHAGNTCRVSGNDTEGWFLDLNGPEGQAVVLISRTDGGGSTILAWKERKKQVQ